MLKRVHHELPRGLHKAHIVADGRRQKRDGGQKQDGSPVVDESRPFIVLRRSRVRHRRAWTFVSCATGAFPAWRRESAFGSDCVHGRSRLMGWIAASGSIPPARITIRKRLVIVWSPANPFVATALIDLDVLALAAMACADCRRF